MNNTRRETIAKAIEHLNIAHTLLEQAASDEQDYFDNLPEGFQQSERGQNAEQAASDLQEAVDSAQSAIDAAEQATSY